MSVSNSSARRRSKLAASGANGVPPAAGRKPAWDSTLTDVHSLRASNAELERRHVLHQSHNAGLSPSLSRQGRQSGSVLSSSSPSSLFLAGPGESQRGRLTSGEHAFSAVQDLFGDDPKRYSSAVHATPTPPGPRLRASRSRLEESFPSPSADGSSSMLSSDYSRTQASPLAALNDTHITDIENHEGPGSASYSSQRQAEWTEASRHEPGRAHADRGNVEDSRESDELRVHAPAKPAEHAQAVAMAGMPTSPSDDDTEQFTSRLDRIADSVKLMSTSLEQPAGRPSTGSFHGHSGLLLETVLMLTSYLKEGELRAAEQERERQQLSQHCQRQQILLDGLASDMLALQTSQQQVLRQHARLEHGLQGLQVEVAESLRQTTESFRLLVEGTRQQQYQQHPAQPHGS